MKPESWSILCLLLFFSVGARAADAEGFTLICGKTKIWFKDNSGLGLPDKMTVTTTAIMDEEEKGSLFAGAPVVRAKHGITLDTHSEYGTIGIIYERVRFDQPGTWKLDWEIIRGYVQCDTPEKYSKAPVPKFP